MAVTWCQRCAHYHDGPCASRNLRPRRRPLPPLANAVVEGLGLGLLIGGAVGGLTQEPAPFALAAALACGARLGWYFAKGR